MNELQEKSQEIITWRLLAVVTWFQFLLSCLYISFGLSLSFQGGNERASWWDLNTWLSYFTLSIVQQLSLFLKFRFSSVRKTQYQNTLKQIIGEYLPPLRLLFLLGEFIIGCYSGIVYYNVFLAGSLKCTLVNKGDIECGNELNDKYLIIVVFGGFVNLIASIENIYRSFHYLDFPAIQQNRWFRVRSNIGNTFSKSLLRVSILILFIFPFTQQGTSLIHFIFRIKLMEFHVPITFQLIFGSFLCGLFVSILFEISNLLIHIVLTERTHFISQTNRDEELLIAGLSEKQNSYIQHLAFLDLKTVSYYSKQRRENIFRDVSGKTWTQILNRCCDVVDNITTSILDIKNEETKPKVAPVIPKTSSPWDIVPPSLKIAYKNFFNNKKSLLRDPFEDIQLQIWSIEAASKITVLSLEEDKIGIIQNCNTIPLFLNSLLACLIAVEDYIQRPLPQKQFQKASLKVEGFQFVRSRPQAVATALTRAIYSIVTAFYENLTYFEFIQN